MRIMLQFRMFFCSIHIIQLQSLEISTIKRLTIEKLLKGIVGFYKSGRFDINKFPLF